MAHKSASLYHLLLRLNWQSLLMTMKVEPVTYSYSIHALWLAVVEAYELSTSSFSTSVEACQRRLPLSVDAC
jgi:hypothetical protein